MSSRLVALDLYLRLREKPRLARAGSVVAARARMERVTRLVPLPRGLAVAERDAAVEAVFRVLSRHVSDGEVRHVRDQLPAEVRDLWEVPA